MKLNKKKTHKILLLTQSRDKLKMEKHNFLFSYKKLSC